MSCFKCLSGVVCASVQGKSPITGLQGQWEQGAREAGWKRNVWQQGLELCCERKAELDWPEVYSGQHRLV